MQIHMFIFRQTCTYILLCISSDKKNICFSNLLVEIPMYQYLCSPKHFFISSKQYEFFLKRFSSHELSRENRYQPGRDTYVFLALSYPLSGQETLERSSLKNTNAGKQMLYLFFMLLCMLHLMTPSDNYLIFIRQVYLVIIKGISLQLPKEMQHTIIYKLISYSKKVSLRNRILQLRFFLRILIKINERKNTIGNKGSITFKITYSGLNFYRIVLPKPM